MQLKNYLRLLSICVLSIAFMSWTIDRIGSRKEGKIISEGNKSSKTYSKSIEYVYDSLQLDHQGLSQEAFEYAIHGFEKLDQEGVLSNDSVLTIIDFDQPSYRKRLYVIDVKNFKVLFNTLVAHGKNTGKEIARFFSNTNESHKSSLGFYITEDTYNGSKGYSLKLRGLEKGINNNAYHRAIVMHGADYVSESFINAQGYIGRSHGCPAVPVELNKPIIQTIKDGSCLFIYNKTYKPSPVFHIS
ncbi:murein L,D-transpeptidase catalytic domain family protein [Niabella aquatica]